MDEIKKLLNVQVSTYRYYNNSKLIYLLRFIKILIFNVGIIKFLKYLLNKDKNKFENYSKTWKQQIKDDIKLNQNWRRDRKYFNLTIYKNTNTKRHKSNFFYFGFIYEFIVSESSGDPFIIFGNEEFPISKIDFQFTDNSA